MPFFCPIASDTPPAEIDNPLGSGPYYIASRVSGRQIVLDRNRFYRGARPANVDHVVFTVGVGQSACDQSVEQNAQDWCDFLPPTAPRELAAKYGINKSRFFFNPSVETDSFAFNHDRPAFKGPRQIPLMQAINWAIDRRAMVAAAGYLAGKRTDPILPPAMSRPASIYPLGGVTAQSLARARTLLERAKLKPDKLVLYTGNLPLARGEPFDVGFNPWAADYPDGSTYFQPLLNGDNLAPTGNENRAYFNRPKYNREIDRIDGLSGAARRKAWAELDVEMMRDDPPWAPFMNQARDDFVSRSFGCYVYEPAIGMLDIVAACKK